MNILNRSAITISYKKPFIDWNNDLTPDMLLEENMLGESKTYLTNAFFDDAEKLMKKYFKDIFEMELEGMWTDENDWPQKRTFKLFNEWFNYEVSDIVIDLSKNEIYD
ncbi:MAG: hypothetical protein PSX81_09680 [bacterium]|nr:hypothetical protein [bacterium]